MQTFQSNQSSIQFQHQSQNSLTKVPLKFKAIILKSLYDKHRHKEMYALRNAFLTWYIQKNDNEMFKDHIDRLLIAEKESKFTASRFFYRMKLTIRKQLSTLNQKPSPSDESKQKSSNSQIKEQQNGMKKNFTNYFESLKNIFSMKLIECEKELISNSLIGQKNQKDEKNKDKRFKTEGCKVETLVDQSFIEMQKFSVNKEKQKLMEKEIQDRENNIKELGKKVALTLIKSVAMNIERKWLLLGFVEVSKTVQLHKFSEQTQLQKSQHLKQLSLITKQSSSIKIQTQPPQKTQTSQSFLETSRSSSTSIPPLNHIDSQISHVEYSLNLLSQTIKKDFELQQLYREFQEQFGQFESIEKDFEVLRVKTRNSLFDRLVNVKKKLEKWLLRQAFTLLFRLYKRRQPKSNTQNICRSRVNLQTLHQIFSKPLIPSSKLITNQNSDLHSQMQFSTTSIKIICEKNSKTQTKFYKTSNRGGIKKQIPEQDGSAIINEGNLEILSTFGFNFKQQPTRATQNKPKSCNQTFKTHVNFVLPQCGPLSQSIQWSSHEKKSEISISSIKDCFRKKDDQKMKSTGFYELSMKSFESNNSSSPSTKYHAQMKSQYWWNDLEEKENLANREENFKTKQSVRNQ